jgi:hypothetical protein
MIRYNADTGLLEYLVNGRIENAAHTTPGGREGGNVYTPFIARDGSFILGGRFNGMIDEFRIYKRVINAPGRTSLDTVSRTALELPELAKFPRSGGRIETRTLDLGEPGSTLLKIEASGGRFSGVAAGTAKGTVKNIYAGTSDFHFADSSTLQFFIRSSDDPYGFSRLAWTPVALGADLGRRIQGRYIQMAVAFYPSGNCETTPYLEEIRIIYEINEAPHPPSLVTIIAKDGEVELSWRSSPDQHTKGYLVYYGISSGVYYGDGTIRGEAPIKVPIDAGNRTSLRIDGLKNGTLYYFVVAAYDRKTAASEYHSGKFSREVSGRPLRMSE